ncbi:P-loop containing nucleoside triphosphate hydrolase protein, partial [Favolaschia claudopus]
GNPQYACTRPHLYPQTDIFLLRFSVASPSSFATVRDVYVREANHFCAGVPWLVVGMQIDLRKCTKRRGMTGSGKEESKEMISTAQGEEMAWAIGASAYMECSAKTGEGVQSVFDKVCPVALLSSFSIRYPFFFPSVFRLGFFGFCFVLRLGFCLSSSFLRLFVWVHC